MEKLKCTSCGGEIKIDDDREYGTCPYCGTKYKMNSDLNVNIKMDDNVKSVIDKGFHFSKFLLIPIIAIFILVVVMIGNFFLNKPKVNNTIQNDNGQEYIDEFDKMADEQKKEGEKTSFNMQFSNANGTKNAFFVKSTLDKIIESNKTHERVISLTYDGTETTSESDIINIKHSLDGEYEVIINYDNDGYVNNVTLNKI